MRWHKIDLHIHTALSCCSSLEMTPRNIVRMAYLQGLSLIAVTDHNSTLNCEATAEAALEYGLQVIYGMELQTIEEVHVLTLFSDRKTASSWEKFITCRLPHHPNHKGFGPQLVFDECDRIVSNYPWILQRSVRVSFAEAADHCHRLDGLFIPSHINRPAFSLLGQLGMLPEGVKCDAYEIVPGLPLPNIEGTLLSNSDAHQLCDLVRPAEKQTWIFAQHASFSELRLALSEQKSRRVVIGKRAGTS